ncbi:hypothetical protein PMAYCL1PPCAC_28231, partial [Pristionchus mayeri]
DDSSSNDELPSRESSEKDANTEKTPSKPAPPMPKIAPPKTRNRSPTPVLDTSDSDNPEGDIAASRKPKLSKTPEPPNESTPPSKESGQPSSASKTESADKSSISTPSFKPLAASTPKPLKVQAPGASGAKSYGVAGAVRVSQTTVKGVRKTQVGEREFYDKYPWLKPSQPSALAASETTSEPQSAADPSPPKPLSQGPLPGPQSLRPGVPPRSGVAGTPANRPANRPAPRPYATPGTRPGPSSGPSRMGGPQRPTGSASATPVTSYRDLAKPYNVTRLGALSKMQPAPGVTVSSPALPVLQKLQNEDGEGASGTSSSTPRNKLWKKPWSEMSASERLEQRKLDMQAMQDKDAQEEDRRRTAYPRPPPTTVAPTSVLSRGGQRGISDELVRRFMETASHNAEAWRDEGGGGGNRDSGGQSASDMLQYQLKPFKRDQPSTSNDSTPKQPAYYRMSKNDPFAPPAKKPFDPYAQKKKRMRYNEKKAAAGKSPEKGKKGGETGEGAAEGEERPNDENNVFNDFNDDFGGGEMSDHGGEGSGVRDGGANVSSSIIDVGSPVKGMNVKKEGLDGSQLKVKNENDQDSRRKELLTPSMKQLYSEEMAALAREKAEFERQLMEKMSKDQEKLPALPSLSQLQSNLRDKPDDLKSAMDRLVDNMKRIGSTDDSSDAPQGELTMHLNKMMDTMKKDVFLGTVRTEVYEAEGDMFAEAAYTYVKTSNMTKLREEDYARGQLLAKAARQEREQRRARTEKKRDDQRRTKMLLGAMQPKARISKKALSKLTEAQRLRRSLPAPRTPPGSPSRKGRTSRPVSTAGSRDATPDRLPQAVTPPGSPPPFDEKSKRASGKRLEVCLDDSFDMPFDESEGDLRKQLKLEEDRKKRDLQSQQRGYEFALQRVKETEKPVEQRRTWNSFPPQFPGPSTLLRDPRSIQSDNKMKKLMRLSNDFAKPVEQLSDDDLLSPIKSGPSILSRGGVQAKQRGFGVKSVPPVDSSFADAGWETPLDLLLREEQEEEEALSRMGKKAVEEQREALAKERQQEFLRLLKEQEETNRLTMRGRKAVEEQRAALEKERLQRKLSPRSRLSVKEKMRTERVTEQRCMEDIESSTAVFEELFNSLTEGNLTEKEKEMSINKAINRAGDMLDQLESAMRVEQRVFHTPSILSDVAAEPVVVLEDDDDDEDVVLKSKRSHHRSESVAPALTAEGEEGEIAEASSSAAPPTLDAQPSVATTPSAVAGKMRNPGEIIPLTAEQKKMITMRLSSLWKMSEELPSHIKAMARRAMPSMDALKAKTILDLRARIVAAERLKEKYHSRRASLKAQQQRNLFEEFRTKHEDQVFDKMLQKMIDDQTEIRESKPEESMQVDEETPQASMQQKMKDMSKFELSYHEKKERLRKEDEIRREELRAQAKKRAIEERRKEEETNRKRDHQRSVLGGVVVSLKSGERLSMFMSEVRRVDPPTDPEAAATERKKVLIRKELTVKERESLILAEFYDYWRGKKSNWNATKTSMEMIEKYTIVEMNDDLKKGAFPATEKRSEETGKDKEREGGEEQPGTSEKASPADASIAKEGGEEQPGTSEESTPADASKEKAGGEGAAVPPSEEMKQPHEMDQEVKLVYNRWRQTRKMAREVRLNTGTVVDEVELEEVEVPEGMASEECEDTRPYHAKGVPIEVKKDEVSDRMLRAWASYPVNTPERDFVRQLGEKQRILRKHARGEKLTSIEKKFLTMELVPPKSDNSSPKKGFPVIYEDTNKSVYGRRKGPLREGRNRKVAITRLPDGGTRVHFVPLSKYRSTPRAPVDPDAQAVKACMADMLKQLCGDDEEEGDVDALEVSSTSTPPPCFDGPSDNEVEELITVTPKTPRGGASHRRKQKFPTIMRTVPGAAGKVKTIIWTPASKTFLLDTTSASTPQKDQDTPKKQTIFVLPPKKRALTASAPAAPKTDEEIVRQVVDRLVKDTCAEEAPPAKKNSWVWKPVPKKSVSTGASAVSPSPGQKEIFLKPAAAKLPSKLIIPKTPLMPRSAPVPRKRDAVRDVVEHMVRIVCAQLHPLGASEPQKIVRRIVVPGQKKDGSDAREEEAIVLASDADDDIVEVEDDDGEDSRARARTDDSSVKGRQKVMRKKRKQPMESFIDSDEEDIIFEKEKKKKDKPIILRLNDPIRIPERKEETVKKRSEFIPSTRAQKSKDGSSSATLATAIKEALEKKKEGAGDSVVQLDQSSDEENIAEVIDDKLGWIDCLRLVEEADGGGATRGMRKIKKKMDKMERRWLAVDAATARKLDEQRKKEGEPSTGRTVVVKGARTGEVKRVFTTKSGKKIVLKPRKLAEEGKKGEGEKDVGRRTIVLKGAKTEAVPKKRYFITRAGKKIYLKPKNPLDEGKNAPVTTTTPPTSLRKVLAAASKSGSFKGATATATAIPGREFKFRPVGMPKLAIPQEKGKERIENAPEDAPDLSLFDDDSISTKPSKRVVEKKEERKRRAGDDEERPAVSSPKKKKYQILDKDEAPAAAPATPRTPSILRSATQKSAAIRSRSPVKTPAAAPVSSTPRVMTLTEREKAELIEQEKEKQKKKQEWEIRQNEASISQQKAQIEMQKKLLAEVRKEMVKTFENADRTNKLVEQTRRAMIGECTDFGEYRKLVDAREKLMNTLYEQTMEKMKSTVAAEETRRRFFENYRRKAIRREKTLIKEVEHAKEQLDKAHQKQLESGLTKKAPLCPVPFTKAPLRSRNNRFNFVLEAVKRVFGDGVEGDEELEKEQVKAIIDKLQRKFSIPATMTVEQDREFCADHEIGYRKRINMKKFLAKLGLDFFCSQRSFDKVRRELGEADGTEETEMIVKRERKERKGRKEKEGGGKRMIDPREISLGRSRMEEDEASDVDIEEILVDEDFNIIEGRNQTVITDGEMSGAERERAERRYNMERFAGARMITSDEDYVEESDPDQPGPSSRYIPIPARFASVTGRSAPLPPPSAQSSHYLHGPPILQPVQQRPRHLPLQHTERRGRGGARVRGGHNQ